jgi:glycosyltransferase involved in cell wall biosynthesis
LPNHDDAAYDFAVVRLPRGRYRPLRWLQTILAIRRLAASAEVVYLNGLVLEGIIATKLLARRAAVVKVVGDLIWERARNQRATSLGIEAFQDGSLPLRWRLLRRLQGWYTGLADAVITPSRYLAGIVAGWGVAPARVRVVYNAVELPQVAAAATAAQVDIVTVSRLVPWKGLADLIAVVAENGWSLRIVGDGPMRDELEAQARALNANVMFRGQVQSTAVPNEIRNGRLFVLNSSYEGLPHIVLEAKAAGAAVLASAAGGTPETIDHGVDGWLVPVGDHHALAMAISRLLNDDHLRQTLAHRGQISINERFSYERMVRDTESVLQEAAA